MDRWKENRPVCPAGGGVHGWSRLTLSWMTMKLVRGITESESEWLTLKNTARPVISKGQSTILKFQTQKTYFTIQRFAYSLPPKGGLDCGKIPVERNWQEHNKILIRKKKQGEKHVMLRSVHRVHWVEWFCIHTASIWTWTGSTTTGHSRGQLCHSAQLKHPRGAIGVLGSSVPHQVTGRSATGRGFYWATINDTDHLHRLTDHPKPPLSHLLWLQLKGPVCSKAIHQLQRLLIRSSKLMSLSTLVLGEMIEDLFGSPCDTCSGYQLCTVSLQGFGSTRSLL